MADSDSKSIGWTNDTTTSGHRFTYAAQKAKLSVRSWPGAAPAQEPACTTAWQWRCTCSGLCWHLGAPLPGGWSKVSPLPAPPVALRTPPFNKGRRWPQQLFWKQNSSFSLKPCHRLDLERDIFSFISFLFPIFMWSPPLLFNWWLLWWDWMNSLVK